MQANETAAKADIRFERVETDEQIEITAKLAKVIWHECFAKILSEKQIEYMVTNMQSAPAMTKQIRQENYSYYLLYFSGEETPGGYIGVQRTEDKLLLSKLYFLAEHRGKNYSPTVIEFVEELGREKGATGVWLTVNRHNRRAISIYHAGGFEVVREQQVDIGGGYIMDDFVFEKPL